LQCDRELPAGARHRQSAKQAFSSGNTGPQRRVARMGHDQKIWCDLLSKCFWFTFFLQN